MMTDATNTKAALSELPGPHPAGAESARSTLTLEHADRWTWRPRLDPARCRHAVRAFFVGTPERLTKRCGGCGTVLADDLPRCPATNKKTGRHCRLPARHDRGYATCAAHREVPSAVPPIAFPARPVRLFGGR